MARKGCKVEISGEKDNQKDDSVRQSEREMKDDCGENCPEWRKGVTGSGGRETYQAGSRRESERQTEREIDSDRGRERDELREDAESVPLSRLLPEANRQPRCCWNANATSCSPRLPSLLYLSSSLSLLCAESLETADTRL